MINHADILREELKKANNQVNKKHSILKKEMQKTIEVFQNNIPVFPYQVCFRLFKHVMESNSSTNCMSLLPFFQATINLGFANEHMTQEILMFLSQTRTLHKFGNMEVQMKVQQLLILLISKNSVRFSNLPFVYRLMNMLFSLQNGKSVALKKNSISSIVQIFILLINETKEDNQHEENLIKLFKEYILLSDNVRPEWFDESLLPDRELAINVLSQLTQQSFLKEDLKKYEKLLISLISITTKNLYALSKAIATLTRKDLNIYIYITFYILYVRTVSRSSRLLCREFEFLETIMKQLTNKDIYALKLLSHEAISHLFNDFRWMNGLIESPHQQFLFLLLSSELNEVRAICSDDRIDIQLAVEEPMALKQVMLTNETQYFFPQYFPNLQLRLIIKDIEEITFSLYSIYMQIYKIPLDQKYKCPAGQTIPISKAFTQCQKIIFEIVKLLIAKDMSQSMLQSVLKIIEKFINLSGCFGDYKVCGLYIKLICKYCLPNEFRLIDYRHVQINKMVLNTANCLGNLLDTSAWTIIWKALENYESYYNKYLLSKDAAPFMQERQNDVQILYQSLDSIFTQSVHYDNEYLMTIIDSLVQVTYECLENNFNDEGKKIFSFERIGQVYRLNISRLCHIWPSLSSSLLCITTSKVSYFRVSALGLLNQLIPMSLSYLHANPDALCGKFTAQNYQRMIFEPWLNLVKCKFPELKEQIIVALNKIVNDYGHVLTEGWGCIFQIIREIGDFKSMQVIVDTFLDRVDNYIDTVVEIIHQFKSSLVDSNQKYLCLTFLWTIGDHSHKTNKLQLLQRIFSILLQPQYPFVFNPEARHSAFYIFTELLIHNCGNEPYDFWVRIFHSIETYVKYVMEELKKTTDPKIVEQAGKNILLNLIKIYKKYFPLITRHGLEEKHQLGFFYQLNIDVLALGNTDLYVLCLKQVKEIMTVKLQESLETAEFRQFLLSLVSLYVVSTDLKLMKCLISYMPPDIFEILQRCTHDLNCVFHEAYRLMERVFLLRLEAEEKEVRLQNSRIFFEQRLITELLKVFVKAAKETQVRLRPTDSPKKELSEIVLRLDSSRAKLPFLDMFSNNFQMTMEKLLLYEDYFYISKFIPFAVDLTSSLLNQGNMELSDKFPKIFQKIMLTKYSMAALKKQSKNKDMPVWHYATQQLIKLCAEYIKNDNFIQAMKMYRIFVEFLEYKQQPLENIVKHSTPELMSLYFQNQAFLLNYLLTEFIQSSHFMDINLEEVGRVSNMIYVKSCTEDSNTTILSYSQMNLDLLFKTAQHECQSTELMKRTAYFILYLFRRVLDIFQAFFSAQRKFGSLPVNQKTLTQLSYAIEKLQKLTLQPKILEYADPKCVAQLQLNKQIFEKVSRNPLLQSPHAHLIFFHKILVNCIRSKEQEIRQRVSSIFEIINGLLI